MVTVCALDPAGEGVQVNRFVNQRLLGYSFDHQTHKDRYEQPAVNQLLLYLLSKLLESWKINNWYTGISGIVPLLSQE